MTQNNIPKTMRAAVIEQFGGVEQIKIKEVPVPKPGADEVLIRIEAAGVGVWDVLERQGGFAQMFNIPAKFPYIIGTDCAGTIAATGENVTEFRRGRACLRVDSAEPEGRLLRRIWSRERRECRPRAAKAERGRAGGDAE
jgi:NADPH:quinone reductase and related Zn-dependent oxidoreductases